MFKYAYSAPAVGFDPLEAAQPVRPRYVREPLNDDGVALLARLAGKVVLTRTAAGFPHVINQLARHVHYPQAMGRAIDALLLLDDFQKRQGFPFDVLVELGNLKSLYDRYNLHEGARRPRGSANLPVRR
jgi:hypothetical protein